MPYTLDADSCITACVVTAHASVPFGVGGAFLGFCRVTLGVHTDWGTRS